MLDDYGAHSLTIMEHIQGGLWSIFKDDYGVYFRTLQSIFYDNGVYSVRSSEYSLGRLWRIFYDDYGEYSRTIMEYIQGRL